MRQPAAVTAVGQVIAAFSPPEALETMLAPGLPEPVTPFTCQDPQIVRARVAQAQRDGYVIWVQQIMVQEIVIAAPVIGANRQAVAAISMPVYLPERDEERVRRELVPAITDASRTISSIVALS